MGSELCGRRTHRRHMRRKRGTACPSLDRLRIQRAQDRRIYGTRSSRSSQCLWAQQGGWRASGAGCRATSHHPSHLLGLRSVWQQLREDHSAAGQREARFAGCRRPIRLSHCRCGYCFGIGRGRPTDRARQNGLGHFSFRRRWQYHLARICRRDYRLSGPTRGMVAAAQTSCRTDYDRSISNASATTDEFGARLRENCNIWDPAVAVAVEPWRGSPRVA